MLTKEVLIFGGAMLVATVIGNIISDKVLKPKTTSNAGADTSGNDKQGGE